MLRLAHVTDVHLGSLRGARLRDFIGKRFFGGTNLLLFRRRKHLAELARAVADDVKSQGCDHVMVTGDLSNLALPGDWDEAQAWLERLGGGPARITVVPGNHDVYVPAAVASGEFMRRFAPFMAGETLDGEPFPFLRLVDPHGLALIGINTCVPTRDLGAWGRLGTEQLGRIERLLADDRLRGRLRVVLMHHPPVVHHGGESRNLRDRAALLSLLQRSGADLVLHGHDHRDERASLPGPDGQTIPVVGTGSASYAGSGRRARYNIYEIEDGRITVSTRAERDGRFLEVARGGL